MDGAGLVGNLALAAATVAAAVIAARANHNAKAARNVSNDNRDVLKALANGKQKQLIKQAMEEVAREHPHLVSDAIANELVVTVLESILDTAREGGPYPIERHPRRAE